MQRNLYDIDLEPFRKRPYFAPTTGANATLIRTTRLTSVTMPVTLECMGSQDLNSMNLYTQIPPDNIKNKSINPTLASKFAKA